MSLPSRCPFAIWKEYPQWGKGVPYSDTDHYKVVWHTTQGSGIGALAWYNTSGGIPKFTIIESGAIYQHYDMNRNDRGLRNLAGGVQTNLDGAISVELAGFAGQNVTAAQRASITRLTTWFSSIGVVAEWMNGAPIAGKPADRLSFSQWDNGSGHCGHRDVPENNHVDPAFTSSTLQAVEQGFNTLSTSTQEWYKEYNQADPAVYNDKVDLVQEYLDKEGYYEFAVDGRKGPITDAALIQWKADNGFGSKPKFGEPAWIELWEDLFTPCVSVTPPPSLEPELQACETKTETALDLAEEIVRTLS